MLAIEPCRLERVGSEDALLISVGQMSDKMCLGKSCQKVFGWLRAMEAWCLDATRRELWIGI
jgi:hypothetical protein